MKLINKLSYYFLFTKRLASSLKKYKYVDTSSSLQSIPASLINLWEWRNSGRVEAIAGKAAWVRTLGSLQANWSHAARQNLRLRHQLVLIGQYGGLHQWNWVLPYVHLFWQGRRWLPWLLRVSKNKVLRSNNIYYDVWQLPTTCTPYE